MAVTQDVIANVLCLSYAVTQHHSGGASLHGIDQENIPRILCHFPSVRSAGKMADLHVYFISALVLSCCIQILAG